MPIFKLALKAWIVGLLTAVAIYALAMAYKFATGGQAFLESASEGFSVSTVIFTIVFATIMALIITAPLFLLGWLLARLFHGLIIRNVLIFTILGPVITLAILGFLYGGPQINPYGEGYGFWGNLIRFPFLLDTLIFTVPVGVAAFYFGTSLRREQSAG